ncbi:MAG TPA: DUF308 domain-containing protein [Gemmatimonadaceae bacterium]|jgi:uncharacterized membrane protein HdeD (DUF308 family)
MQDSSRPVRRFATVLQGRGAIALACGAAALAWPDGMLLRAMLLTALVLAASGVYEMGFAYRNRHRNRGWPLALADGAACFGMAVISVTLTAIPFHATMFLAAGWLFACGVLALLLALAIWPMRRSRLAMLAWSGAQLALAAVALFDDDAGLVTLLYVGAAYTIGFGLFQIVAAQWMRRMAMPQFEPTRQQSWLAAHPR